MNSEKWSVVRLDHACDVILGQSPPGKSYNTEAKGLPFFQGKAEFGDLYPKAVKWCNQPSKIAEKDDVLISVRAPVGPTNLCPERACIGRGLAALRPRFGIPSRYVLYAVRNNVRSLAEQATGSTFDAISGSQLRAHTIPLAPSQERQRIVAEIEKQFTRLDAGVASLKRVQASLKRYRASVLKAACEGKQWPRVPLGNVVSSMKNGIYKPRSAYADDGIACLRMYNIEEGRIVWKNIKRMKLSQGDIEEYKLSAGDLLVNRVNSRELVGKTAPIPDGLEPCVFESKNIRVRLKRDIADPKFVGFAMTTYGPNHFNQNAQQVVGMASISQPQVAALKIPLPPIDEQARLVGEVERKLSVADDIETVISANLRRAARLRNAVLRAAFAGKVVSNLQ